MDNKYQSLKIDIMLWDGQAHTLKYNGGINNMIINFLSLRTQYGAQLTQQ